MSKNKFKIGEFSKLNHITVKTLRHYEKIGLLRPNEVDEWTGYRYYDVSQFKKLSHILYLKRLRFSLEEILGMFESGMEMPSPEMLKLKIEECKEERQRIENQYIELLYLNDNLNRDKKMNNVFIKSIPEITVASFRKVIKDYDELSALCCQVIGPEMQRCGCTCHHLQYCYTVEHNKEHKDFYIDLEYCEAVDRPFEESAILKCKTIPEVKTAVCINHKGSYKHFSQSMTEIMSYLEKNGYVIMDHPRFSYIDGPWNKNNEEDYLTIIEIPVKGIE